MTSHVHNLTPTSPVTSYHAISWYSQVKTTIPHDSTSYLNAPAEASPSLSHGMLAGAKDTLGGPGQSQLQPDAITGGSLQDSPSTVCPWSWLSEKSLQNISPST